ncbi:hypothetical protein LTR17_017229 [Elasticomyces elasticus]|nr:hypothetical protein LTR17_017229 [Elasticomyces elasticus]
MADPAAPVPTLIVSTAVTDTDHAKIVTVAGWLCIRWPLQSLMGWDDGLCFASTLIAVIQTAVVLRLAETGFGRTEDELRQGQSQHVAKAIFATDVLFILSLWTGRASVSLLLHRLAGASNKPRLYQSLTVIVGVLGVISLLVVTIRPDYGHPWIYTAETDSSTTARWAVNGALSILCDLLAIAFSVFLVWNLQMGANAKTLVITAFSLRLFVLPATIIRLVSISSVNSADFSFSYALPEAYTQLEMYCNLIATTLPCLRLFLTAWNTNFMDMRLEEVDPQAYQQRKCGPAAFSQPRSDTDRMCTDLSSANKSGLRSIPMFSMKRGKQRSRLAAESSTTSNHEWQNQHGTSTAMVETGHRRDSNAASDNSTRAIVVKQTVTIDEG